MSEDSRDGVTLIGLHRLSSGQIADVAPEAPVPGADRPTQGNVLPFPEQMVRHPGTAAASPLGPDAASGRNVVAFAPPSGKTSGRSRKA
jgi:hypothetical protein